MKFSVFSAVLFSIGWMSVVVTGDYRPPGICCLTVSNTRVPVENIVKYEMQESTFCPLRVVIFYTKRGVAICSDPDSKYAQRVMDIVDARPTVKPAMYYTITTNTIPAVTTTNKTPGKKTETNTNNDPPPNCCLTVSDTRVPVENIVKYDKQDPPICSLRAVRFYTKKNITICSDPDSQYAKRVMEIVDGRTTAKPTMCYTSTTNTIPAVTTTNETPGKKTETSTIGDWVQDYMQSSNKRKTTEETDQSDFANNYFCLKKEQAEYFCIKQP